MNEGWRCPNCGRGNAPWLASCSCGSTTVAANNAKCYHGLYFGACLICTGRSTQVS